MVGPLYRPRTMGSRKLGVALFAVALAACVESPAPAPALQSEQKDTACATGQTVNGIDVSVYDTSVDWPTAKGSGIDFAFIRVSDGTQYPDPSFAGYWAGAGSAGVYRGAYQYFRPSEDPIAQADLLLDAVGTLGSNDLPPVLDLEVNGGLGSADVVTAVQAWIGEITAATGRPPIIYAGLYSWPELTGGANLTTSPLWVAQYTTAACPDIPDPWTSWLFWQHSDTGVVDGVVSSQLDLDYFNGTLAQLQAFTFGGGSACGEISGSGGIVDDSDPCFTPGGPSAYMRHVTDAGYGGELYWTHTTTATAEANYGQWNLTIDVAGAYRVDAYTAAAYATSHAAHYAIEASGSAQTFTIDQTAVDGWQTLGEVDFAAGGGQWINLGDNTGEATEEQLVFDAIRLTPLAAPGSDGSGSDDGSGSGNGETGSTSGGCSASSASAGAGAGATAWIALVALALACMPRRRARSRGR